MRFGLLSLPLPAASLWPPHIVCQAGCWVLCNRMYHVVSLIITSCPVLICSARQRVFYLTGPNSVQHVLSLSSLRPLFISQDVAVCLRPTDRQTDIEVNIHKHRHTVYPGLTGSERVVHWTGYPSLPGEQGPAQAHIVRRVSDAELGHQQQPARPLHLRLSVLLRPSAGWGGSDSPGTVTSGRACSLCLSGEAPNPENNRLWTSGGLSKSVSV